MGYFAETMALFEFKGDAESAYERRRTAETMSGDHKYGKHYSKVGRDSINSNSHGYKNGNGNDIIKSDKFSGTTAKEKLNDYSKKRLDGAKEMHGYLDRAREFSKSNADVNKRINCKESFEEAFASVIL